MKNLRLRVKLGLIIGILVLAVVAVAITGYWEMGTLNRRVERMVETTSKTAFLLSDVGANVQRTRRMELCAVVVSGDKESREYAAQSREIANLVDDAYPELSSLIDSDPKSSDRQDLEKFRAAWQDYRKIQEETLNLAVENSNVKAHTLATGKIADKVNAILQAAATWLRQMEKNPTDAPAAKNGQFAEVAEKDRQAIQALREIALDLHRQLSLYVYDSNGEEMDRLDERIAGWQKDAEKLLAELAALPENKENQWVEVLGGGFRDLKPLTAQMQKLLRANTNARSFLLSESSIKQLDDCRSNLVSLGNSLRDQLKADLTGIHDHTKSTQWLMILVPLIGILVSVVLAGVIIKSITAPLARGVDISAAVAGGDLTRRIGLQQSDEVGQLAQAIDHAAASFGLIVREIQTTSQNIGGSAAELSSVSHQMLAQSEEMTAQANSVAGSTEQMTANVNTMAAAAEEMSMNVLAISSASEEISVNVGTISSAAETAAHNVTAVAGAIRESADAFEMISKDARDGSTIADKALAMADDASETMQNLDHSAAEIDKVTEAIKMIALQTNLLALNATIEATSAGEAGKGFAVVANEIKELAHQSAKAAEDIARKIEGVQSSTCQAVQVIGKVQEIIRTLNVASGRIAAAVEKQSAAAKISTGNLNEASKGVEHIALSIAEVAKGAGDMSRNAGEAAQGAGDVSRNAAEAAQAVGDISCNIHGVSQATRDNTASAQQVNSAANGLSAIAEQLKQLVSRFKIEE